MVIPVESWSKKFAVASNATPLALLITLTNPLVRGLRFELNFLRLLFMRGNSLFNLKTPHLIPFHRQLDTISRKPASKCSLSSSPAMSKNVQITML